MKEKPFSCGFCEHLFSSAQVLFNHICTEHSTEGELDFETYNKIANNPFVCSICFEAFSVQELILKHVTNLHLPRNIGNRLIFCPTKNFQLRIRSTLNSTIIYIKCHSCVLFSQICMSWWASNRNPWRDI